MPWQPGGRAGPAGGLAKRPTQVAVTGWRWPVQFCAASVAVELVPAWTVGGLNPRLVMAIVPVQLAGTAMVASAAVAGLRTVAAASAASTVRSLLMPWFLLGPDGLWEHRGP